jgi:hypothetical protein
VSEFSTSDSWKVAVRLAAAVGRLRVASNLKAVGDAQQAAFVAAGEAAGHIAEAQVRDRAAQVGRYREAAGALARCRSWIEIIAELTNEPVTVFDQELELVDHATKLVTASLQAYEARDARPEGGRGPREPRREDARPPREEFRPRPPGRGRGSSQPGGLR